MTRRSATPGNIEKVGQRLPLLPWPYGLAAGVTLAATVMVPVLLVTPDRLHGVPGALAVLVAGMAAVWSGPMIGAVVAVVAGAMFAWVLSRHGVTFGDSLLSTPLWALAAIGIGVLAQRLRETQATAARLLRTDPLTGLFNRRSLNEALLLELDRTERDQGRAALVMLDLDGFKEINDRYGHSVGDELLVEVAARLSASLRTYDVLTRWGGDELCLLLPSVEDENDLHSICWKLSEEVKQSQVVVGEQTISVNTSIGCVILEPGAWDPTTAVDAADLALYAAKQLGGDRVRLYTDLGPEEIAVLRPRFERALAQ